MTSFFSLFNLLTGMPRLPRNYFISCGITQGFPYALWWRSAIFAGQCLYSFLSHIYIYSVPIPMCLCFPVNHCLIVTAVSQQ